MTKRTKPTFVVEDHRSENNPLGYYRAKLATGIERLTYYSGLFNQYLTTFEDYMESFSTILHYGILKHKLLRKREGVNMGNLDKDLEIVQQEVQEINRERYNREVSTLELALRRASWEIHTQFGEVSRETLLRVANEIENHLKEE